MYEEYNASIRIETPENLELEAEIAGFGSRFLAAFIDYTIIIVVIGLFSLFYLPGLIYEEQISTWGWAVYGIVVFALIMFYHLVFEFAWNGQTPGKRRVGLRVVMNTGMPVTSSAILARNFIRLFDFLPLFYGFGLISVFATRTHQRLGDLAAGTFVLKEQTGLSLQSIREDFTVLHYEYLTSVSPLDENVHLEHLAPDDRRIVVTYLNKRGTLPEDYRQQLAIELAHHLKNKMAIEEDRPLYGVRTAETFLEQIARAFEVEERAELQRQRRSS